MSLWQLDSQYSGTRCSCTRSATTNCSDRVISTTIHRTGMRCRQGDRPDPGPCRPAHGGNSRTHVTVLGASITLSRRAERGYHDSLLRTKRCREADAHEQYCP